MLHAAQANGVAPGPYAMQLHRERMARRARMLAPLKAKVVVRPDIVRPDIEVIVYPAYVFVGDCDHENMAPGRVREIQNLVCQNLRMRRDDLLSARRDRLSVCARQVAMYLCKRHTPNSFPAIGRPFRRPDHPPV